MLVEFERGVLCFRHEAIFIPNSDPKTISRADPSRKLFVAGIDLGICFSELSFETRSPL